MALKIIGTGVGRTGTYSLKSAITQLGLGPCHHMEEVLHHMPVQLPLWQAAVKGSPDWAAIYDGYQSAVDWPTAGFFRELSKTYPKAKFILTVRSPESWAASFSETIYTLLAGKDQAPPHMREWLDMAAAVIARNGFPAGMSTIDLAKTFTAHNDAVKAAIPPRNLLVYEVKQGWSRSANFWARPFLRRLFHRPTAVSNSGSWSSAAARPLSRPLLDPSFTAVEDGQIGRSGDAAVLRRTSFPKFRLSHGPGFKLTHSPFC